jgi:hypothetical protein
MHKLLYKLTNYAGAFFLWCLTGYELISGKFITIHKRPMYAKDVLTEAEPTACYSDFAIVIQGPIITKCDFTLETVRLYKKHFPKALIVVSTWNGEESPLIKKIRQETDILLSDKPAYNGPFNINLQLTSTYAGIKYTVDNKVKYILKTRTDQRMYSPVMLSALANLIKCFPIHEDAKIQKKRFVGLSMGNMRDHYRLSDSFMFGDASDMLLYWSLEHVQQNDAEVTNMTSPENYLFRKHLENAGADTTETTEASESAYAKYCLFVESSMIDWYWYKYDRHREHRYTAYKRGRPHIVTFFEWLCLLERH